MKLLHFSAKMPLGTPSELLQAGRPAHPVAEPRMNEAIKRLGRFQIVGRLATGGMAEVYLGLSGELPGFRTLVVVKRILPHLASNRQFIRMFLDEARLAALLDHPNVVRIIEVGHDGEEYFLAMELVQGKPLSAVLRKASRERRPPSAALSAYVLAQAARGLGYAHALTDGDGRPLGVVHRDVSPQNVLISFEGAVKLIDFGVARAFGRVAQTSPGGLKGKIEYMSPEQASAEEIDHRADVFALGVVLWEVLTGRRLYRRETELATMRAILDDAIPRPSQVAVVPPELDAVVMRALRKHRDARFASAHEMASALERYAFSTKDFSPQQVASYMKGLFASEFMQWRKTATAALDVQVEPMAGLRARVQPPGDEPITQGPTMALGPGVSSVKIPANTAVLGESSPAAGSQRGVGSGGVRSGSGGERGREPASGRRAPADSREPPSAGQSRSRNTGGSREPDAAASAISTATPPSKRDRLWVYGGLSLLAAITGAGAWTLARPFTIRAAPIIAPAPLAPPTVARLSEAAAAAAAAEPAPAQPPAPEPAQPPGPAGQSAAAPSAPAPTAASATTPMPPPQAATLPTTPAATLPNAPPPPPPRRSVRPHPHRRSRAKTEAPSPATQEPPAPSEPAGPTSAPGNAATTAGPTPAP
jgi:eukaryotic-like serine/threonine-protein kinase